MTIKEIDIVWTMLNQIEEYAKRRKICTSSSFESSWWNIKYRYAYNAHFIRSVILKLLKSIHQANLAEIFHLYITYANIMGLYSEATDMRTHTPNKNTRNNIGIY